MSDILSFTFKERPEDFVVEEVPEEPFCGYGEHLVLKIRKTGVSTLDVVSALANKLGISQKLIGYLGLKDKEAVAVQFLSVPQRFIKEDVLKGNFQGFEITETYRHNRKLRVGALKGNRFRIVLKDVSSPETLIKRMKEIEENGFPNFYDAQRFGEKRRNVDMGLKLLKGEKVNVSPYLKRLYVSAVSSWIFNRYLLKRIKLGLYDTVIEGDLLVDEYGFWVPEKYSSSEEKLIPTGPIAGYKMPLPSGKALELETQVLKECNVSLEMFKPFRAKGSRRPIKVYPQALSVEVKGKKSIVSFFLPKGSYATTLLRWLKDRDATSFC